MARIGAELERLKRETDLAELVRASGVELEPRGKELVGRCPFHDDDTPSLHVSREKNLWHCMGACQEGGSVIDWVMKQKRVSFVHAVEQLRAGLGASPGGPTVRPLPPVLSVSADDQQLLDDVCGYYHQTLKESPEALGYLEKRGLQSAEMVDAFKLGFANRTLGLRLPLKAVKEGGALRERLQRVGILRESGHEHLNGSLVIPILDEKGHVKGMYGRKVTERLREGTALHLYLPGPHRGVFNIQALKESADIILCEALIDALTFWCAGFHNVTSAYGADGFTDEMAAAFTAHGVKRVYIAFDRDAAGDAGAAKVSARLMGLGIECLRVQFPLDQDANQFAKGAIDPSGGLRALIHGAAWMGRGVASQVPAAEKQAAEEEAVAPRPTQQPTPTTVVAPTTESAPARVSVLQQVGSDFIRHVEDRRYRVRGLDGNKVQGIALRVNLSVYRGERFHDDTLDLHLDMARDRFIRIAARELEVGASVIKRDVGEIMMELEMVQESRRQAQVSPVKEGPPPMTEGERAEALALLKDADLLGRIVRDLEAVGLVGERTNKLLAYVATTSRKLQKPLAVIIRSGSGAGKSSLMDAVVGLMPDEDVERFAAMTGQALFYMPEGSLRHKVLALAEEEGSEKASYALKILQSEGRLQIASTGKNLQTGRQETTVYKVEGPVMVFQTTTRQDLDEEFLNRCIELRADESQEQTRAIHAAQREAQTLESILGDSRRVHVRRMHQNAQRLLRALPVWNPWARGLTFPDDKMRTRRDHRKYLALIESIALLHQHQRTISKAVNEHGEEVEYIEVTAQDIELANHLATRVLGTSLDELLPQTRALLMRIEEMVERALAGSPGVERGSHVFIRRELREFTGWGDTQLKVHLARLVELELVNMHRQRNGFQAAYTLAWDGSGKDGSRMLQGLISVDRLAPKPKPNGHHVGHVGVEHSL